MSLMTLCLYVSRPHKYELLILYQGSGCTVVHPYNLLVSNALDRIYMRLKEVVQGKILPEGSCHKRLFYFVFHKH